jgi:hypothetical protein
MTFSCFQNIYFNFFVRVQIIQITQQEDRTQNEDSFFPRKSKMRICVQCVQRVTSLEVLNKLCNQGTKRKKKLKKLSHLNFCDNFSKGFFFFVEIIVEVDQCHKMRICVTSGKVFNKIQ